MYAPDARERQDWMANETTEMKSRIAQFCCVVEDAIVACEERHTGHVCTRELGLRNASWCYRFAPLTNAEA
jgi:hypothetical protein